MGKKSPKKIYCAFFILFVLVLGITPVGAQTLVNHGIYRDIYYENGKWKYPIGPQNTFSDPQGKVVSWLYLDEMSKEDIIEWRFFDPTGKNVFNNTMPLTNWTSPKGEAHSWYKVYFFTKYGQWKVDILINGVEMGSDTFTILPLNQSETPVITSETPRNPLILSGKFFSYIFGFAILSVLFWACNRERKQKFIIHSRLYLALPIVLVCSLLLSFFVWILGNDMLNPIKDYYSPFVGYSYIFLMLIILLFHFIMISDLLTHTYRPRLYSTWIAIIAFLGVICYTIPSDSHAVSILLFLFPIASPPLLASYFVTHYSMPISATPTTVSPTLPDVVTRQSNHHDVFISYSQQDKPVADAITARLEAQNIRCWIAPRDILPGLNFQEAIIDAIDTSSIMVLIFSSHSNNSPHVLSEATEAMSKGVIIIPFRIENVLPTKAMKYLLSTPHWLDAMTPPLEKHIDELSKTIEVILNQKKSTQPMQE